MPSSQTASPFDLVRFNRPPVTEVALTAQFSTPIVDLGTLGAFAAQIEKEFPTQEQRPPAEAIAPEEFGQAPGPPPIRFEFRPEAVPLPRLWFISQDGERLVQLQADRLSVNWRSMSGDPAKYPRYTNLREVFERQLRTLSRLAKGRGKELRVSACEVLYVNPVTPLGKTEPGTHPDLASVINRLRTPPKGAFLGKPEDSQWQARWRIPSTDDAKPVGRLHVSANPALSDDQRPLFVVQMNARITPSSPDAKGTMAALDVGHKWVVKGFEDITTNRMHKIWEKESN